MKLLTALAGATSLALVSHLAVHAAASSMTVSPPPGLKQVSATGLTVTNTVSDAFTVTSEVPLHGQVADFNGGAGSVANSGPTWTASSDWTNSASDYVTRSTGSGTSIATLPWLNRETTASFSLSSFGTSVNAGVVLGADQNGTEGIAAVMYRSGSNYQFGLFLVSESTATACSSALTPTGTAAKTISITFDPGSGSAASGTISGTGGGTVTSTCSLSGLNGSYAGFYSGSATTARYDTFSAAL